MPPPRPHPDRIAQGLYGDRARNLAFQKRASHPDPEGRALRIREDLLDLPLKVREPQIWTIRTDLFHQNVPEPFIDQVLDVICGCPQHLFLACTNHPEDLEQKLYGYHPEAPCRELGGDYLANLWLGITAENQEGFDRRWEYLRRIPAAVLFVSHQPALGPITYPLDFLGRGNRAWIIASGETGSKALPMHPDWPRRDRDQCQAAGVPFWFTHWGEFCPMLLMAAPDTFWDQPGKKEWGALDDEGNYFSTATPWNGNQAEDSDLNEYSVYRVGRKETGRILDGRTWEEMPEWK
jgi:protein gp37